MANSTTASSWLTIDLDAVAANYQIIRNQMKAQTDIAAVVKANGYGLGAQPIAETLYQCGARQFFVATMDEALHLRAHLPDDTCIATLCGLLPSAEDLYTEQRIMPVLNALDEIKRWSETCAAHDKKLPAIIHFDTGMNRLGLGPDETAEFLEQHMNLVGTFDCTAIMSHFACADDINHPMTAQQAENFKKTAAHFPDTKKSLANSSGLFRAQDYHYDFVRPGMAMYGLNPTPETKNPMRSVVKLETRILQTRTMRKGDTAGYSATYRFDKSGAQATVSLGYADGFLRHLGNGHDAKLYFNGQACKITGRVSMDLITVDISNVQGEKPQVGDTMEVFGPNQSADALADGGGTIGYEILTSLGRRYHREYLNTKQAVKL